MDQTTNKGGYTAFAGAERIAAGTLSDVAVAVKTRINRADEPSVLIFSDETGRVVDVDYRGSEEELRARLEPVAADTPIATITPRGRGRPRLGVVAREVTLLPRHWEWLSKQPGGASAAVRR